MAFLGRKTLKSQRARMRRIDMVFERLGQSILILYFVFFATSWVSHRESLRIDSVTVLGAQTVDASTVERIAHQFLSQKFLWKINRDNALFYPKHNLSLALLSFNARIKSVETSVPSSKLLSVKVTEYDPKYLWCKGEAVESMASSTPESPCYLSDDEGYIFADAPHYSGYPFDVYRTNIPGSDEQETPIGLSMLPGDEFDKVQTFINALGGVGTSVVEVRQIAEHDYSFKSNKPWLILWSSEKDSKKSIETIELATAEILREKGGTTSVSSIDVRFGNKIFYK